MALDDKLRASLMAYCRIDDLSDPADAAFLEECWDGAVDELADAGVSLPEEGTPRYAKYMLCAKPMVLDAWDNRGSQIPVSSLTENPAFRKRLNQLKHTEPVSNLDTGSGG